MGGHHAPVTDVATRSRRSRVEPKGDPRIIDAASSPAPEASLATVTAPKGVTRPKNAGGRHNQGKAAAAKTGKSPDTARATKPAGKGTRKDTGSNGRDAGRSKAQEKPPVHDRQDDVDLSAAEITPPAKRSGRTIAPTENVRFQKQDPNKQRRGGKGRSRKAPIELVELPVDQNAARSELGNILPQAAQAEDAHQPKNRGDKVGKTAQKEWRNGVLCDVAAELGIDVAGYHPQGVENQTAQNQVIAEIRKRIRYLFSEHKRPAAPKFLGL